MARSTSGDPVFAHALERSRPLPKTSSAVASDAIWSVQVQQVSSSAARQYLSDGDFHVPYYDDGYHTHGGLLSSDLKGANQNWQSEVLSAFDQDTEFEISDRERFPP